LPLDPRDRAPLGRTDFGGDVPGPLGRAEGSRAVGPIESLIWTAAGNCLGLLKAMGYGEGGALLKLRELAPEFFPNSEGGG